MPTPSVAAAPALQRCEFNDGQVLTLMVDSAAFPMSVARCTPLPSVPLAAVTAADAAGALRSRREVPPATPTTVTVIEAAGSVAPRAPRGTAGGGGGAGAGVTGRTGPFADLVHAASRRYSLDADLLHAIIRVESNGNPRARSPAGAIGLMQVMPGTGARYGVRNPSELLQPEVNIDVGARYLSDLRQLFGDRLELVVAAYNAGEGSVMRYGMKVPPFAETQDYVQRVLERLRSEGTVPR